MISGVILLISADLVAVNSSEISGVISGVISGAISGAISGVISRIVVGGAANPPHEERPGACWKQCLSGRISSAISFHLVLVAR